MTKDTCSCECDVARLDGLVSPEVEGVEDVDEDEVEVVLLVLDGDRQAGHGVDVAADAQLVGELFDLETHLQINNYIY